MGKLQLTCSVKEAWIFLNLPFFLSLLLCRADESLLRFNGPRRVNHGYKILTDETPVTFVTCRSLVACVSTCLGSDIPCFSVNFQSESGICELLVSGSGNQMEGNLSWSSVTLTEQTATTVPLTTADMGCPDNFVPFAEKCYKIFGDIQKTIPDATDECEASSAELLSLETQEEQDFINQLIMSSGHNNFLWTSGRGLGSNAYQWSSSGKPMVWSDFASGFPGGYYGQDSCVYIAGFQLTWQVDSCDVAVNRFICEYPQTP